MSLEIVFGPMFSGKTTVLAQRVGDYHDFKKKKCLIINHTLDDRPSLEIEELSTHGKFFKISKGEVELIKTNKLSQLTIDKYDFIAIDEGQFFEDLVVFVRNALKKGKDILCCGLISDSEQNKFGNMIELFPQAYKITQKYAYCNICGNENACFTKSTNSAKTSQIDIGGKEKYIAVCLHHLHV